jgi:hypothetical protein
MAPVTRGKGNRFAHTEDMNDREELVREESLAAYQAHLKAQFASLREQIAALTKNYCPSGVVEIDVDIYSHRMNRKRMTQLWRMKKETLLRSAECTGINPLYKLRPIGGNPVSNSIHQNSKVACNPKSSWWQKKIKTFHKSINRCLDILGVRANNFNVHASWEARSPSLSSIQGVV